MCALDGQITTLLRWVLHSLTLVLMCFVTYLCARLLIVRSVQPAAWSTRKLVEDARAGRAKYIFVEVRASRTAKIPLFQAVFCV